MSDSSHLRALLDAVPSHIVEVDAEFRVRYQNENSFQYRLAESIVEQLPKSTRRACENALQAVLRDGKARHFLCDGGGGFHFRTDVTRIVDEAGVRQLCLVTNDLTDETTVREEERQKLAIALEASQIGLWSWNLRTDSVVWDRRMREMTGHDIPLNLPSWVQHLTHPDDREAVAAQADLLKRPGPLPTTVSRIIRPDGQVRWIMFQCTVRFGSDGQPLSIVGASLDVTERQRLNEKLQAAERMEALGHLTAGVAHNFNNMLMVITPCLEAIEESASDEMLEDLRDAIAATDRAAEVVRQLMAFAGQRYQSKRVETSVSDLIDEVSRLCRRSLTKGVSLATDVKSHACISAAAGSIQQVLSNVINNARDALSAVQHQGSCIEVHCRDVSLFDEDWVEIVVSDNGPGVPEELRSKIFEPFVTTKNGKGTGLGLASSLAIVEQHGGQLACRPRESGGTEFLILLPAQAPRAQSLSIAPPADSMSPPDHIRVLIVDDEVAIRRLIARALSKTGMSVECAECEESLEKLLQQSKQFDFVLLDRSLRESQGKNLLPRLRLAQPKAKIFYFTGEPVPTNEATHVDGIVQKPLEIRCLIEVIRTAVGESNGAAQSEVS